MQGASREAAAAVADRQDAVLRELSDGDGRWRLSEQLAAVVTLLDRELPLRRVLADPSVDPDARAGLAESLLTRSLEAPALGLVLTAVRQRWSHPVDLLDELDAVSATAGFAAAELAGVLDSVEDELFRFTRILDREGELYAALASPQVAADRKEELVRNLLADKVHDVTMEIILRAVTNPRGRTLERALENYLRLAAERRSRLVATVASAVPIRGDQTERLRAALRTIYRSEIQLQVESDPALIGGVVVRVGDEVIDASIASRLDEVRRGLSG